MAAKPKQRKPGRIKRQSERFIETARSLGADETGATFERAFGLLVPPKRPDKAPINQSRARAPVKRRENVK
jgi:hypothetical protein